MAAMRKETAMFFTSLLRDNRPIRELVDADYTYLNEELATTLYQIDDVTGEAMRRVELDDPNRGGILTHPSVLTVTSSYKQTSPIKRGVYVLETILGTPPPPPPPDAGELDPKLRRNRRLTFREKLNQHSSSKVCRSCHALIDPMGFAMENFDFFGRWRDTYRRRRPIDAAAELEDGTQFEGPQGLKEIIVERRHEDLVRHVTTRLLAYGLGRQLEYYDEPAIESIMTKLAEGDYRFQVLLQAIVESYPFQYRKDPSDEASP